MIENLDERRAVVDELGTVRDTIGALGVPGDHFVDRDEVLAVLRSRVDRLVFGGR